MTTLNEWFQRAEGDWKSDRRYLYAGKDKFKPQMIYTDLSVRIDITDAEKEAIPDDYNQGYVRLVWDSVLEDGKPSSSGEMQCGYGNGKFYRSQGYMTDSATICDTSFIDDDTVVFHTSYDSWIFREEIRLIDDDRARLRQTVAWRNGDVKLVGQFCAYRCHDDSNVRTKIASIG